MPTEQRFRLELLNAQHPIEKFFCENDDINDYLHDEALADMAKDVARTFVEIDSKEPATSNVAGFFTLRADALSIREDYFEDWADKSEDTKIRGYKNLALIDSCSSCRADVAGTRFTMGKAGDGGHPHG